MTHRCRQSDSEITVVVTATSGSRSVALGEAAARVLHFPSGNHLDAAGGLLMRDHDAIDGELRLVAGLRRTAGTHREPTSVGATLDELLDNLLDELLEERHGSSPHPPVRADCSDLGPLCW